MTDIRRWRGILTVLSIACAFSACASLDSRLNASEVSHPGPSGNLPHASADLAPAETSPSAPAAAEQSFGVDLVPSQAGSPQGPLPATQSSAVKAAEQGDADEFYDPFQKPGEEPGAFEEYDPWESFNVAMFNFNRKADRYVIKPLAEVYDHIMPDELERGLSRGFANIGFVPRFFNSVFQGKFKRAGIEVSRFLINTTFGLAGMLDFAKEVIGLEAPLEDSGQTLGLYGAKPGPYLILPLFPQPLTLRDGVGYLLDTAMNPMNYFLPFTTLFPMNLGYHLNERSINLETFQGEDATVDLYGAVRNAYLQKRAAAIRQ